MNPRNPLARVPRPGRRRLLSAGAAVGLWLGLAPAHAEPPTAPVVTDAEITRPASPARPAPGPAAESTPAPARWLAALQATYVWQHKPAMAAAYTDPTANSLGPEAETGYTLSATLHLGARPWRTTEVWVDPEVIQSQNLSALHGLGGPSNGEAQKGGGATPALYLARAFIRQTIPLGGEATTVAPGADPFGLALTRRRLVLTAGVLSILDVFDGNPVAHDARTQFLNWALLTHGAWDYAADARGYTWGLALAYEHDGWSVRAGRFLTPKESNGLALDFDVFTHYGDQLEIERRHELRGRPGRVRLLGFHNREKMAAFADAIAAAETSGSAPSLAGVRRTQSKLGAGLAVEQALGRGATAFLRGSLNDGRTETYSFTEIDRSVVAGASLQGELWLRPLDTLGAAWVMNGLSAGHRDFLARGGHGFFLGDGQLDYGPEHLVEIYYAVLTFHHLWLTGDFQHVRHPAYNRDRGPANFLGVRMHVDL
jgi:high affinity Mn2+ porin